MRKFKPIDKSTFWIWTTAEAAAMAGAFLALFVFQQQQAASGLFIAAIFSFFYRSLNYRVEKE